eukprot:GHVU01092636.1.p3 GENE.GHVU01092636.1~~GHVU01092636.1.p3  ORF type:complete len:103 (-),score=4.57 GHVU01092636.1:1130-1438(-)
MTTKMTAYRLDRRIAASHPRAAVAPDPGGHDIASAVAFQCRSGARLIQEGMERKVVSPRRPVNALTYKLAVSQLSEARRQWIREGAALRWYVRGCSWPAASK